MPLVLNEEQRLLKDTAKEFLASSAPVEALRKLRDEKNETGYDTALWQQMAELGWAGIVLPEDYDGLDFGFMGLGAIIEESGRTLTASPLISSVVLGASAILLGGNDEQKQSLLPAIASGEKTLTLAIDESSHHNPATTALSAESQGDSFVLSGKKVTVIDGHTADHIVVAARTSGAAGDTDGISLFIVDGNAAGLTRTRRWMADSRAVAELVFDKVSVDKAELLGELDKGWDILDPVLDRGRICLAAEMLGGLQECFERTVEYLKEREQFGRPICEFQGLQWMLADMSVQIEAARALIWRAAGTEGLNGNPFPDSLAAAQAKIFASEMAIKVTSDALQLHGARGYSRNWPMERLQRDARMFTIGGGTAQILRTVVASRLLDRKLPQTRDGHTVLATKEDMAVFLPTGQEAAE